VSDPHPLGFPTLTLRGGGWILLALLAISGGFLAWALSGVFTGDRPMEAVTIPPCTDSHWSHYTPTEAFWWEAEARVTSCHR